MKKTLLLVSALFLMSACTDSATPKNAIENSVKTTKMASLKTALDTYSVATKENDVDTLMSFVYPKVFTLVPKEKMTSMLKKMYASGKAPQIKEIKHINYGAIKKYDKGSFSVITSLMSMDLKSPKQDQKFEEYMLGMLKQQLSEKSTIKHNKEAHTFTISNESKVIGIKEGTDSWKFVGYSQAKKYASKDILPKAITDSL
jgi:hypothetical protein